MGAVLYTIVVFPLVQIIELCYLFVYRIFSNPVIALFGVSLAVSVLTLPLYFRAEKWQQAEREAQKRLAPKVAKIKAVFSGDLRYMVLSAYYRQNHYHPVYAMRNTFSLLIQIPFFIAAYSYLSRLEVLQGSSFLFIRDLGAPDALLPAGAGTAAINILPIAMTAINCISGAIYTRGLAAKDKIQIYGTALVFLALLYNSPSGLALYWTMNNIFSLLKNILVKSKHTKRYVYGILFAGTVFLDIYVLFFHHGYLPKRLFTIAVFSSVFLVPLFTKLLSLAARKFDKKLQRLTGEVMSENTRGYILTLAILFLIAGLVIPGSLIASAVEEFSFIESYTSSFPFILHTLLQAAGIFLFWPICIYLLFPCGTRRVLSLFMTVLSFGAFFNVFLANENFGFLTNTLVFSEPKSFAAGSKGAYLANLAILSASTALVLYLIFKKKKALLFSFRIIVLASLFCYGILNIIKIQDRYAALQDWREDDNTGVGTACYTLSKTGKNVVLIMLDAAVSGYVPYIFEERPELASAFLGFTWYPNCVSFAGHTLVGAPPIYGGYEYTPEEINRRDSVPLAEKHKEAYLLLPRIFSEAGYSVTVTDPPFDNFRMSNLGIFAGYPQIHAKNVAKKYGSYWLNTRPGMRIQGVNIAGLLRNNLIRFSIFKMAPLPVRSFIYDDGDWLTTAHLRGGNSPKDGLTGTIISDYAFMDLLPELTAFTGAGNTYTAIYSSLPHSSAFLQAPDYIPSGNITGYGKGPLAADSRYHVNIASFLLLEKFFRFLKDEGVYDNSRIILVSDHGRGHSNYNGNIALPDGSHLQSYHSLLMVKDFNASGTLETGNSFMTNGDTIFFALKDIVEDPVNPFTNQPLQARKSGGVNITTIGALSSYQHTKYKYSIGKDQWLRVSGNIFDPANWKKVEP
ncbi:MAG: YidC/Oxa1 family membrane protein insertase [Treponema sp.]|jgi:YidC/Oxa1 family membrane protein insertase|nr:YidC/Oxa1 family membrane protein insertase [Treponema sp.]